MVNPCPGRDYVKGYHFMNQLYVYWESTWLDKA